MNTIAIAIEKFNMNQMVDYPTILIIGDEKACGKTTLIHHILQFFEKKYPLAGEYIVCPKEKINPFYKWHYLDCDIKNDIDDNDIKKILLETQTVDNNFTCSKIVVFDNCLLDAKSWTKNGTIMELVMNGRFYKIPLILSIDTPIDITPEICLNFDYVFLFGTESDITKKKLWDSHARIFSNYSSFISAFDMCTKKFRTLVIDNRNPKPNE